MTINEIFKCCYNLHIQSDIIVYQGAFKRKKIFEGELHMFLANFADLAKTHEVIGFKITDIELKKAEFIIWSD